LIFVALPTGQLVSYGVPGLKNIFVLWIRNALGEIEELVKSCWSVEDILRFVLATEA